MGLYHVDSYSGIAVYVNRITQVVTVMRHFMEYEFNIHSLKPSV